MANTRYLYLIDKLKECGVKAGSKIIDCGCGNGDGTDYLQQAGYKVSPFDISDEVVDFCREKRGINAKPGSILDTLVSPGFFDVFVCSETLEHIDKKYNKIAANQIKQAIKIGGYICITVPEDKKICLANKKHKQYLSYRYIVKMFAPLKIAFKGVYCKKPGRCNLVVIFKNE